MGQILALLAAIKTAVQGIKWLAPIARFLRWVFSTSSLDWIARRVAFMAIGMAVGGPFIKAIKIAGMVFVYFVILRILGNVGLDDLANGFFSSLGLLSPDALCALKLLGFSDCFKLLLSTAATVGSVKILLRLATS